MAGSPEIYPRADKSDKESSQAGKNESGTPEPGRAENWHVPIQEFRISQNTAARHGWASAGRFFAKGGIGRLRLSEAAGFLLNSFPRHLRLSG
jgi:hypothetical protein